MSSQPGLTVLADKIRKYIQSQDWRPFLKYNNMLPFAATYTVRDGVIRVVACDAGIRCGDGAIVSSDGLASDRAVIHLYTSHYVLDGGRNGNSAKMLAYVLSQVQRS